MNAAINVPWLMTAADQQTARQLQSRLPESLFDVHMHVYRRDDLATQDPFFRNGPDHADLAHWRQCIGEQVGCGRLIGALCTPDPRAPLAAANAFAVREAATGEAFRATMLVAPDQSPDEAEALIQASKGKIAGFKPYHLLARQSRTFDADLDDYLPSWAWRLADRYGLVILLHLVKDAALADPGNLAAIRSYAERFPNARVILAHAARGFHAANTVKGIAGLQGLHNIWFDSSAICESDALTAILDVFGPRRLMWGTDFPISEKRGRSVSLGTGFAWLVTDEVTWNERAFFGEPVKVGLESLSALLSACDRLGLNPNDLGRIFAGNALHLLGLAPEDNTRTQALYRKARGLIPGGTQLLSKRPEMFAPGVWPAYAEEARGCEIVDLDGRRYLDFSTHGIGACLLGFRDPDVTRAVQRRVALGSFCTLNPPEEVELAERLCAIHPWADRARFTRAGGEAMCVAVRIARATTDRPLIAVCGYHGWHDWYLAANLGESDALRGHLLPGLDPRGVPAALRDTTQAFAYGDLEAFTRILETCGDRLAAVVMEPCRHQLPAPGFLDAVREGANRVGALLVFDEITIGWRLCYGGAHLMLDCTPDIAVFAKSLGNGHPIGAIIGTAAAMDGAHTAFISSTYWTEGVGPVAALATLHKLGATDVPGHLAHIGRRLQALWRELGRRHQLPLKVNDTLPALPGFAFTHDAADMLQTLFTSLMLDKGFLAKPAMHLSLAHTDALVDLYAEAVDRTFSTLAKGLERGDLHTLLKGATAHHTFRRLL